MRRSSWLVLSLCSAIGCQQANESQEQVTTRSTSEALSYDAIRASLNGPPHPFWTATDDAILGPIWKGDDDHGSLYTPLWRGANAALEDYVYAPPDGDCRNVKGTVRVDWDREQDTVHFMIKMRGMPNNPTIDRTPNVNYWPNPFHNPPEDFLVTGYRLWSVFSTINTANTTFYYDAQTLHLLGSEHDFPGGAPANSFPVGFPVFPLISSGIMQPDANGNIIHEYTISYAHVTQEGGTTGHAIVSFIPLDLCQGNPADPTAGQLRPYVSPWFAPGTGPSWPQVLHSGLFFDGTIEDISIPYPNNDPPYVYSGVAFMSNVPALQGGVPNGHHFQIGAAIRNVQPVTQPIDGGNGLGCQPFVSFPRVSGPNLCAPNP
ncbi:MAG TPA: hypothetical protein PK156_15465 [Polyangium sp.]|nr:hypothetical protein [Polyangium sp.]